MHIFGRIISLANATGRRDRIKRHLNDLNLTESYRIFDALPGDKNSYQSKHLKPGEDGLWQSILAVLKDASESDESFSYVHILEDDIQLSPQFHVWLSRFEQQKRSTHDIIFTDMFVEYTIFRELIDARNTWILDQQIGLLKGASYSGCTASWLIPKGSLSKVLSLLEQHYHRSSSNPLPLDHAIREMVADQSICVGVAFPFPTTVHIEDQLKSSIQPNENPAVLATSIFNTILRRRLSCCDHASDLKLLGPLLEGLMGEVDMNNLLRTILSSTVLPKKLRYELDHRLLHLPDNPQARPSS